MRERRDRELTTRTTPATLADDADVRRALDDAARAIGRATVNHLKEMYPASLDGVTKNAERSVTNFVRNRVNAATFPLIGHAAVVRTERDEAARAISELEARIRALEAEVVRKG